LPRPSTRASLPCAAFPILLAALALASPASAATDVPTAGALYRDGPSGRYLMDGPWLGRPDPGDRGLAAGLQRSTSSDGWTTTSVPNAANAGDFSIGSYMGGVYWYRKDFQVPRASARASWILRFESVNYRATVWLNGRLLGRHTGAYIPFELRAAGLRRRGVNHLVVRVDSRRSELDVPSLAQRPDGRFVGGWWNYTGILREIYLRRVDRLDLADVLVRPQLPCRTCAATIGIQATIANFSAREMGATVEAHVDGRTIDLPAALLAPGGSRSVQRSVRIKSPRLWSPDHPNLYDVRLSLRDTGGRLLQRYTVHTGIRAYTVKHGRLYINYEPARLYGANMHEDSLDRGAALTPTDLRQNFDLLRELGATITRAHYPLNPLTLELADRYGIVVWSEIPVYQMQESLFRNPRVRRQSLYMLREMIKRDRNHPSVMVWSIGNENTTRPGPGFRRYVRDAKRAVRKLDSTRLIGIDFAGYPTVGRQSLYAGFDALGVNDYFGWYDGPDGSVANREALGPYLDKLHAYYPRQALFATEVGAEANRAGPVDEKGTYEFQKDFLAFHLGVLDSKPYMNGALVWILRDFRVKPGYEGGNPQPTPPINAKGLVDDTGARKPAFEIVQQDLQGLHADATSRVRHPSRRVARLRTR
jgi:beta-glucuronidase